MCVYTRSKLRVFTLTVSVPGRDTSVDRRAPLNHRSSEKPGPGPSSAITNVYCSRSERMLCGILEQTNTPQPRQGINTGSPLALHTGSSSADGGVEDSWNTHATLRQHSRPHIQTCHIQDIRSGGLHFLKSWDRFLKFIQDLTASFGWELHGF